MRFGDSDVGEEEGGVFENEESGQRGDGKREDGRKEKARLTGSEIVRDNETVGVGREGLDSYGAVG